MTSRLHLYLSDESKLSLLECVLKWMIFFSSALYGSEHFPLCSKIDHISKVKMFLFSAILSKSMTKSCTWLLLLGKIWNCLQKNFVLKKLFLKYVWILIWLKLITINWDILWLENLFLMRIQILYIEVKRKWHHFSSHATCNFATDRNKDLCRNGQSTS